MTLFYINMKCYAFITLIVFFFLYAQPVFCISNTNTDLVNNKNQIDFYREKIKKHPTSYALYTVLAAKYLNNARLTGDTTSLDSAYRNLQISISHQPTFIAYKAMADLYSYQHKFENALKWAKLAQDIDHSHNSLIPLFTEAYIGLGQIDKAKEYLQSKNKPGFYRSAAYAQLYLAELGYDEAAHYFKLATKFASKNTSHQQQKAILWSITNTAGMYLDTNRALKAKPYLEQANIINPDDKFLLIHWAEYYRAIKKPKQALGIINQILNTTKEPAIYAIGEELAKINHKHYIAKSYYLLAEQGFKKTIEAGYIHNLGSLALLYCNNNKKLDDALQLAQANIKYKRDKQAFYTLDCIKEKQIKSVF